MAFLLAVWLWLWLWLGLGVAGTAGAAPSVEPSRWTPAAEPSGPVLALAIAPTAEDGPHIAVADGGTVWVGALHGRLAPVHRAHGVRELAFAPDGSLWIAGAEGLWRWRPDGSARALAPRPGARARDVHRIRRVGDLWLAASADGVHARRGDGEWRRLAIPLPAGPATALAVGRDGRRIRMGVVVEGVAHWLAWPVEAPPGERVARPLRVGEPGEGRRSAADVWVSDGGAEAWTLLRDGCVVGPRRACATLPPGARAERLFHAADRFWLATDRGLLVARAPDGPWRREAPPLGSLATHAVVAGAEVVLAGTERGLHVAPASAGPAAAAVADLPPRLLGEHGEPPIDEVRRAALAYLDLDAGRLRALRRGAERRGWLPTLSLRLDHDRAAGRRDDYDEAFVSGGLRSLFDRQSDRSSGFEASLELEWDLGDVLYHPESVDVSREVRELVELRDDVLDEIHHLYFERRRVLLELLALPADRPLEAARLRLRADELAAGIDAWTGGWFGRRAVRLAP